MKPVCCTVLLLQTQPVSCFTLAHLIIRLHRCLASGGWAGLSTTRRSFCSPTHPPLTKNNELILSHTLSPMRPRETRTFPKRSFKKSDRCPRVCTHLFAHVSCPPLFSDICFLISTSRHIRMRTRLLRRFGFQPDPLYWDFYNCVVVVCVGMLLYMGEFACSGFDIR